ncbi:MAG: hypothetical protein QM770_21190 [Tepidisphaeraceae bacterium]
MFGDAKSESSHMVNAHRSTSLRGLLDQPARQLLPLEPVTWDGGRIGFDLKVDPNQPTYFTVKLSGDDRGADRGRLLLFCEGKQVGYRHIGDVDDLDICADEPRFPGRFVYTTTVLPVAMTKGKSTVHLEVRGLGPIWAYGETWDKFQKPFDKSSRGIYAVYTHTDKTLAIPSDEAQGSCARGNRSRSTGRGTTRSTQRARQHRADETARREAPHADADANARAGVPREVDGGCGQA